MCGGLRLKQDSSETTIFAVNLTWDHALRMFPLLWGGLKEDHQEGSKDGGWCGRKYVLMDLKINWHVCGYRKNERNRCGREANCQLTGMDCLSLCQGSIGAPGRNGFTTLRS